jgi:hypothetical protein
MTAIPRWMEWLEQRMPAATKARVEAELRAQVERDAAEASEHREVTVNPFTVTQPAEPVEPAPSLLGDVTFDAGDLEQRLSRLEARKAALADGYTDEGVQKLEQFAQERGIADHATAAAEYERENPPPQPVETGGSAWAAFATPRATAENSGLDLLLQGDDDGFLRVSIPLALREVRGR